MYEGVFGAHVAVLLSRLLRVCAIAARTAGEAPLARVVSPTLPTFLACSATMTHPEHHFRMLCPISKGADITVIEEGTLTYVTRTICVRLSLLPGLNFLVAYL